MDRLTRRFALIGAALTILLIAGTTGFVLIENYPPFDAFYMTLTTLTTVGYGEIRTLSRAGRIFNSFLIVIGVTTVFFAIGTMTQTIIELELSNVFGKRRVKKMIHHLDNHFIVCGFGRVGRSAATQFLQAGVPFVVVDSKPDRVEAALNAGMLAVLADATRDQTLIDVGIACARGLVAALHTDADDLFLILSAKTLNPALIVAARVTEEEAQDKLRRAGADVVFAPYTNTGYHLAQALLRPHVTSFLDFTTRHMGLDVGIEQVQVAKGSEFVAKSLRELQVRRELGVIVLAIRKSSGKMVFNPPAEATIEGGDFLIVMGEHQNLQHLEKMLAGAAA